MRDPKRIDRFVSELRAVWHRFPDWRFGQLMYNMAKTYEAQTGRDIFYPEDEALFAFFRGFAGLDKEEK